MNCCHTVSHAIGISGLLMLGITGSLHCAGMCGPLSSLLASPRPTPAILGRYHLGRLIIYALLGAVVGTLKSALFRPSPYWGVAIVIPLLLFASGLSIPIPRPILAIQQRLLGLLYLIPTHRRALIVGLATPLLPCGLLYGALASVTAAPTPIAAALWMAAFALGTIPLLWLVQHGLFRWIPRQTPRHWKIAARLLALTSALILSIMLII